MVSQPWVQRLGWTLVHFLWQGTAIAILYAALRQLLGRSLSAQGRYVLGCVALAAMAVAPPLTFLLIPKAGGSVAPVVAWNISAAGWQQLLPGVVAAWLLGVVAFSIRLFAGWRFTARLRATSHPAPPEWQQTLERIAVRVGASRPTRLLVSSLVEIPTVIGWLRPVILLPVSLLTGLPMEHIGALLAHELAHVRRHDYLVSILQSIAEAALFYHPAVWWVSGQIRAEREICCDDLAVAAGGDVLTYARALAELEARRSPRLRPALAADGGSLLQRIRRLAGESQPLSRNLPGPGTAWALILLWLAGIGAAAIHASQTPAPRAIDIMPPLPPWAASGAPTPAPQAPPRPMAPAPASPVVSALLFDPFFAPPQAPAAQAPGPAVDPTQKGSLAGHVTNAVTGEPIKKARVTLTRTGSTGTTAVATTDSVITDASGSFEFLNVYPGDCTLIASRPGFTGAERASSSSRGTMLRIALGSGEKATDLKLRLPPQGVIAGRVVDENGDPAPNVSVDALRPTYVQGVRRLASAGISLSETNDLGEYRIFGLTPGRYYVQAHAWSSSLYGPGLPATADRTYPPVYYPNAPDLDTATRVEVRAGAELGAINFTLRPARAAKVRGRVVDGATGQAPQRASVSIFSTGAGAPGMGNSASTNAKGEFEIGGVLPGSYDISASSPVANRMLSARDTVVVDDSGLTGVLLRLTTGASVAGTVRADGASAAGGIDFSQLRVSVGYPLPASLLAILNRASTGATAPGTSTGAVPSSIVGQALPPANFYAQYPGAVDAQGNYVDDNVPASHTQVYVNGLPDSFYLKSASLEGQETIHTGFEVTGTGRRRLDLVVSGDGAQLGGVVSDSNDKPVSEATVALVPADPALRSSPRLYKSTDVAHNGQFSLKSIPPGKYLIYAWESVEDGAWFDPDFMARYEKLGESVSLDASDHQTVNLKLLSTTEEPSR
jgi:beta-lactamase regulating signal transducer with metallopeptidase domain/protocatechuate 3,4-dioxygenase beta subunit